MQSARAPARGNYIEEMLERMALRMEELSTRLERQEQQNRQAQGGVNPLFPQPFPPPPQARETGTQAVDQRSKPETIRDVVKFTVKPGENLVIVQELENWQWAIEAQFRRHNITADRIKLDYMPEALQGIARGWLRTQHRTGAIHEGTTWEEFLSLLKEAFIPISPDEVNRAKYRVLTTPGLIMEKEVVEFSLKFTQAAQMVGDLSQKMMIFDFLQALKKGKMKSHLHEHREHFATVQDVIKAACTFGNLRSTAYVLGEAVGRTYQGVEIPSGPQPDMMELGAMQFAQGRSVQQSGKKKGEYRGKGVLSPEEFTRRRENGLCFKCGSADHLKPECPHTKGQDRGAPQEEEDQAQE
jgi:hypothetical protein